MGHVDFKGELAAGKVFCDALFIGNIDDVGMIRIYARENASQRGNGSTAVAGTVASAIRFKAREAFLGLSPKIGRKSDVGEPEITEFLDGIPGVNEGTVKAQLANLKASGNYARIINEVQAQVGEECLPRRDMAGRRLSWFLVGPLND